MMQPFNPHHPFWKKIVAPHPSIQDVGEKRIASLLAGLALILAFLTTTAVVSSYFLRQSEGVSQSNTMLLVFLTLAFLIAYVLARTRFHSYGSLLLVVSFLVFALLGKPSEQTSLGDIFYSTLTFMFIISIALFNVRSMRILLAATILTMFAIAYFNRDLENRILWQFIGITVSLAILSTVVVAFLESVERVRLSELRVANQYLTSVRDQLEQRTADLEVRTVELEKYARQLEIISSVTRSVTAIQNTEQLLSSICETVSQQLGFYHTGIFLLDERGEYAVLQAANSAGGQRMLKHGHRLRVGATGIVGAVAGQGKARIALDVGADAAYFDNPDLPETRSEIALPLMVSSQIVGVLDVQSAELNAFEEEDITVLGILANQVSIAIENARLFTQTKQSLAESQTIYEQYFKQDWARFTRTVKNTGYTYDGIKTVPVEGTSPSTQSNVMNIPIKIRGLTIGNITIQSSNPLRAWTQGEISLAETAAERSGLAIENFRLLSEAQRRAAKERTVGEITARIGASVNVREIMQTAVEELGRALPGAEIVLQLQEQKSNDN